MIGKIILSSRRVTDPTMKDCLADRYHNIDDSGIGRLPGTNLRFHRASYDFSSECLRGLFLRGEALVLRS